MTTHKKLSCAATLVGVLFIMASNPVTAATYHGTLVDGPATTLIHAGDATPDNASGDWLRFLPDLSIVFDVNEAVITASDHRFTLASDNGAIADFTLVQLEIVRGGNTGLSSGFLKYVLNGLTGTFIFTDQMYGDSVFNHVVASPRLLKFFLWGYDEANNLGIDIGATGTPLPLPSALLMFGGACLGLVRWIC